MKFDPFVLDCSVTMAWCLRGEGSVYALQVMQRLCSAQAIVPSLWSLEVANVLWANEKRKRITQQESLNFTNWLAELPIIIDKETAQRAMSTSLELSRELDISVYDASYLDLALHSGISIATLDKKLRKAAKSIGVLTLDNF